MKRIVIDARESGTSTGRYIDKLIEHLHRLEPHFEFTILTKASRVEFFKNLTPKFNVAETSYEEFSFGEQYGLVWQLYGIKTDLVHFGMTQQPLLYFGESVTTVHDLTTARYRNPAKNWLVFKLKQWVYKGVILWVARKSALLITPSNYVKKDLTKFAHIKPQKIHVTYEAADAVKHPAEPMAQLKDKEFIMYVGRPQPHKNLNRLIDAFQMIKEAHPGLSLVLAGKKDVLYERLEKQVIKKGLENIIFTGFITEGQLKWLYENTQAYIFPSLSEGFGLPGIEAMAAGAPVVSSNATCLPEVYGNAAHFFDPMDTDDIALKINQVLDNLKLRDKLISAGKSKAKEYSWAETAKQTITIYERVLGSK